MFELKIRFNWRIVGLVAAGLAVAVFLVVVGQELLNLTGATGHHEHIGKLSSQTATTKFPYLAPSVDADWLSDDKHKESDPIHGVISYKLTFAQTNTQVTISQQQMPSSLLPRSSSQFQNFINDQKPVKKQEVGDGTVYYLPAMQNGAPANGSDRVIYATDQVLLFARGNAIVGWAEWAKLMADMSPHLPD